MQTGGTRSAQLPGGLSEDGTLRRSYAFRPMDGALELALTEAVGKSSSTPDAVTRVLSVALSHLGERDVSATRIDSLCVADRQYLMRALQSHLKRDRPWLTAICGHCDARFDLQVDVAALPVTVAGPGFPFVCVRAEGREWRARVPTGADQAWLAAQPEADLPRRLVERLLVDEDGSAHVDDELIAQLDAALDAVAPALVLQLAANCPECERPNSVSLDPYGALTSSSNDELWLDVHRIAAHYHWSEADILGLPLERRRVYLDLIDQARGAASKHTRQ